MVPHVVILLTLVPMTGLLLTRIWYLQVCPYPLGYGVIGLPVLTWAHGTCGGHMSA
jgi:hypothetical protein